MRFFFHLFGTLFFIVWTVIGVAILAGVFLLVSAKPWQAVSGLVSGNGLGSLGGLSAMVSNAGNLGDLVQKMSQGKDIKEGFNSLPKAQQDCLYKELGSKTVSDALAGKIQPTPDLALKAMKCLK